jgi:hypothetical protein
LRKINGGFFSPARGYSDIFSDFFGDSKPEKESAQPS